MMQIFKYPRYIFLGLVALFLIYNATIYSIPALHPPTSAIAKGKQIWQDNNCHTCHQFYGLGGYLGPDLTNVVSKKGMTADYLKYIIRNGTFQMPGFQLSDSDLEELIHFLKNADATGVASPASFRPTIWGTYKLKSKNNEAFYW